MKGILLDKLGGSPVKARWYDPREGTWSAIGQYPNQGIRELVPTPAFVRTDVAPPAFRAPRATFTRKSRLPDDYPLSVRSSMAAMRA
jgi:hypothetical protein